MISLAITSIGILENKINKTNQIYRYQDELTRSVFYNSAKMDYDTSHNLNNITMASFAMESLYPYLLFAKILLLVLDTIGLVVNGLGIDLMWSGIEINHAVYSLVLQDIVLCWLSSFLWFAFNWIWWSSTGKNINSKGMQNSYPTAF